MKTDIFFRSILILYVNITFAQIGPVEVSIDDRLLRSEKKQDVINLGEDIKRFYQNTVWDDNYSDLSIPIYIQIIFEGVMQKGNESIYNCQALFSNGKDQRYFDKSSQFYYNPGGSIFYDPVIFEPLSGFLAYYAHLIIGGEIDTYDFKGGNESYDLARDIALRGNASDYKKGWGYRTSLIDNIYRNLGLRKARLAWYIALDSFNDGQADIVIEELNIMIDGISESYRDIGRDNQTQYFLKSQSENIADMLSKLGQKELLLDLKELDPDRRDRYQSYLLKISE